jgi:hypothetical protein
MTQHELVSLQRSSLLALKAYFSMSLDPKGAAMVNPTQITAAYTMHQAVCRELDGPCAKLVPPHTVAFLLSITTALYAELDQRKPSSESIRNHVDRLSEYIARCEAEYAELGREDSEGPAS